MFCQGYGVEDIAQEAYDPVNQRDQEIDGYDYKPELSTEDVAVYEDPETKKAIVGFRGTSKGKDLRPDVGIALNRFKSTNRYKSDKEELDKLIERYGKDNIRLTGHSLGARSASALGRKYGIKTDAFNTGSTPLQMAGDLIDNIGCKLMPMTQDCRNASKVVHHVIAGDPISAWNEFSPSTVKYYRPKSLNTHSLSNFAGLDI